jgi:hypothetical protein
MKRKTFSFLIFYDFFFILSSVPLLKNLIWCWINYKKWLSFRLCCISIVELNTLWQLFLILYDLFSFPTFLQLCRMKCKHTPKNACRLNRMIFGMETAFWFHVVNVLLHSISSILFTKICYEVIGFKRKYCLLAGIFFAIHPIHTESKSFQFSLSYFLCTFFSIFKKRTQDISLVYVSFLLCTLCYVHFI